VAIAVLFSKAITNIFLLRDSTDLNINVNIYFFIYVHIYKGTAPRNHMRNTHTYTIHLCVERWKVSTPLSVSVFVTLNTQLTSGIPLESPV
jgi:hypothetical protein